MVKPGAEFTARIVPCANCEDDREVLEWWVNTQDEDSSEHPTKNLPEYDAPITPKPEILFPNPTSGEITVGVDGEVHAIVVYNVSGNPVGGWHLKTVSPDHVTLDLSPLPAGTYMLRITTPSGTATKKLVVTR